MAHYHCSIKSGKKGKGAEHAQYIERGGRFAVERYGEIGESERGNLPEWAQGSAARFFAVADERERANGSAYREFQLALPRELDDAQRGALVREFVAQEIGEAHAYVWAIHEPTGANPHVHIMFSERTRDGIERGEEQYFKRANRKQPERGGCLKSDRFSGGLTRLEREAAVEDLRARWTRAQNLALERAGSLERVDHRSLRDQGIEREPGQHRGPAISGIEARGEIAQVSVRREAQGQERRQTLQPERAGIVAEIRAVSREEVAVQRVAVRERRELAQEITGPVREEVLKRVEADRREQLERAQGMAERRVERRQGLSIGGQLKEKLLTQARSLRERIWQQLGRVREWIAERFPDPVQQLRERSRDLLGGMARKARGAQRGKARAAAEDWKRRYGNKPRASVEEERRKGVEAWLELRREREQNQAQTKASAAQAAPLLPMNQPRGGARAESMRAWNEMIAAKPIEQQGQVLAALRAKLQTDRAARVDGVLERAQARHERRLGRVREFAKEEPSAPKGLLGGLRRRAYEEKHRVWRERSQGFERLSDQSHRQQQRLFDARDALMLQAHASRILKQYAPELIERVQAHTREQQRLERERSPERSRGKDLDRDFDLER